MDVLHAKTNLLATYVPRNNTLMEKNAANADFFVKTAKT